MWSKAGHEHCVCLCAATDCFRFKYTLFTCYNSSLRLFQFGACYLLIFSGSTLPNPQLSPADGFECARVFTCNWARKFGHTLAPAAFVHCDGRAGTLRKARAVPGHDQSSFHACRSLGGAFGLWDITNRHIFTTIAKVSLAI